MHRATGHFSYRPATQTWEWSEELYSIFGFEPGIVVPTAELVRSHLEEQGHALLHTLFERARAAPAQPLSMVARLAAADGEKFVGITVVAAPGDVLGEVIHGEMFDATPDLHREAAGIARVQIEAADQSRASIQRAVGAIMTVCGVDEECALEFLRWHSTRVNVKVRVLADRVVTAAAHGLLRSWPLSDQTLALLLSGESDTLPAPADQPQGYAVELRDDCSTVYISGTVDLGSLRALIGDLELLGASTNLSNCVLDVSGLDHSNALVLRELQRFARGLRRSTHQCHAQAPEPRPRHRVVTELAPEPDDLPDQLDRIDHA